MWVCFWTFHCFFDVFFSCCVAPHYFIKIIECLDIWYLSPYLFSFFKVFLAIFSPLYFLINFNTIRSISKTKFLKYFWYGFESIYQLGEKSQSQLERNKEVLGASCTSELWPWQGFLFWPNFSQAPLSSFQLGLVLCLLSSVLAKDPPKSVYQESLPPLIADIARLPTPFISDQIPLILPLLNT